MKRRASRLATMLEHLVWLGAYARAVAGVLVEDPLLVFSLPELVLGGWRAWRRRAPERRAST
jgi:hypothetical protein